MKSTLFLPQRLFSGLFLLLVFIGSLFPVIDVDVWWHLKTGEYILKHGIIPRQDVFSFTINGVPWTNHEWLSQVVFYLAYSAGGIAGLIAFKALVVTAIFYILLKTTSDAHDLVRWPCLVFGYFILHGFLYERPQLFTFFFTALYVYILRSDRRAWILLIPLLQIVWVNMHGLISCIGIGLVLFYALFSRRMSLRLKWYVIIASIAALFINPYTYHLFPYYYSFFQKKYHLLIAECQPPSFTFTWSIMSYYLLLLLTLLAAGISDRRGKIESLPALFWAAASLRASRNIPVFIVLALPVVIRGFSSFLEERGIPRRRSVVGAAAGTVMLLAVLIAGQTFAFPPEKRFGLEDGFPSRHAVDFVRRCGLKGPIFNDYDLGGYLIWKLYPEHKVFLDGRLVEYGPGFVRACTNYNNASIWNALEQRFRFTAAIIPQKIEYMAAYLDGKKDWVLVYWDDAALVYLKDVPENRHLIRTFGYQFLCPNCLWLGYMDQLPREALRQEIERSAYFAPHADRPNMLRRYLQENGGKGTELK